MIIYGFFNLFLVVFFLGEKRRVRDDQGMRDIEWMKL